MTKKTRHKIFTIFKTKNKDLQVLAPKIDDKYGVKKIEVTLVDGTIVNLNGKNFPMFVNDPKKDIEYLLSTNKITEDEAEKRMDGLEKGNVLREVTLDTSR